MPLVTPAAGSKQVASVHADIGANTSGFEKGAASVKSGLKDIGNDANLAEKKMAILGTVVSATTALIVDSYKEYSALAENIRDLSLVSGESAESTSRFIQVLDDYQLTAEDATAAAKKLKDNGLSPTIETLAKLSDQFRGIKDPAERMDFVYDKLGKSGGKFVNMLNQGSEALLANADAINKNLIMSDFEIKMYEVGRLAIDEKTDALLAFRVELGQNVGNVLAFASAMERANEIQQENTEVVGGQKRSTIEFSEALNMAIAEQLGAADASVTLTESIKEQEAALKAASVANHELISIVGQLQGTAENFASQYKSINEDMSLTDDERKSKIAEVAAEEETANRRIILSMLEKQLSLDGLNAQETEYLLSKGQEWGIYSEEVVSAARAAQAEVTRLSGEIAAIPTEKTVNFTITTTGAPPNLSMSTAPAPVGTRRRANAGGGTYEIPSVWGNEGFPLGNSDTASAGELITVTPKGKASGGNTVINIMLDSATPDPERVAYQLKPAIERVLRMQR